MGDHEFYGLLMAGANAIVAAAQIRHASHPHDAGEDDLWLSAETANAVALQRPLPDNLLRTVAKGEREDGVGPRTPLTSFRAQRIPPCRHRKALSLGSAFSISWSGKRNFAG